MQYNSNILVVINPEIDAQVALDKSIRLSQGPGNKKITALVRKKHAVPGLLATLDNKLKVAADLGVTVDISISDDRDLFRAIMRAQHSGEFNLMVKEAHKPSIIDSILLPDDWRLMRSSLVPVLLVHQDNEWQDSDVLLCVDANPKDEEHRALNQLILEAGVFLRQIGDVKIHLATAYPPDMQGVGKTTTLEEREAQYHRACRDIIHDDRLSDAQIHVGQGPAELLIPQLADELKVKFVVLGTVARSGLKSFLLGVATATLSHFYTYGCRSLRMPMLGTRNKTIVLIGSLKCEIASIYSSADITRLRMVYD